MNGDLGHDDDLEIHSRSVPLSQIPIFIADDDLEGFRHGQNQGHQQIAWKNYC